MLITRFSN